MDITSANSVIMLTISSLYPTPVQLQGFSADDIFDTDAIDTGELLMGVDGNLSAGFIYVPVKQKFTLQADSASNDVFDAWYGAEQQLTQKLPASATIFLPSLQQQWSMLVGFLSSYKPLPDAKKVLQPRQYEITWQRVSPASTV